VLNFLFHPPRAHVEQTIAQSMVSGSWVAINFDLVNNDEEEMWSSSTPARLRPKTPGVYKGFYGASWDSNASLAGTRRAAIWKNGSVLAMSGRGDKKNHAQTSYHKVIRGLPFFVELNGTTDYIELRQFQDSGGTRNTRVSNTDARPELMIRWWRPL
jgi:hypothetical protein